MRPSGDVRSGLSGAEFRTASVVAVAGLLAVLDTTIVIVALPQLMRVFDVSLVVMQWVVTGYGLGMITTMPLASWLGQRHGARRVFIVALGVFAVATVVAGLSSSVAMLILARVAQGAAGGLLNPVGTALALRDVEPERRGQIMKVTGLPLLIGPILGPMFGGLILGGGSWRWLFLLTVPLAALALGGALRWIRSDGVETEKATPDLTGALLLVPGVIALTLGFGGESMPWPLRAGAAVLGVVLVGTFVTRAWGMPSPLLRVRLFADARFGPHAAILAAYAAPYFGSMVLLPTYVQGIRHDSALVSALLMIPSALGMGLAIQVAARAIETWGDRRVVGSGIAIAITHSLALATVLRIDTPYVVIVVLAFVQGVGTGAVIMPTMMSASRNLQAHDLGSGTTLLPVVSQVAAVIGTAAVSAGYTEMVALRTRAAMSPGAGAVDAYRLMLVIIVVPMVVGLWMRWRTADANHAARVAADLHRRTG